LSDLKELNQQHHALWHKNFINISASMGVSRNFYRGEATSKFYLSFSGCWRCNANGCSQNASPFLPQ